MEYDFFEHINSLNLKDGVYPWNYVKVTGLNETKGTITFRGSKSKDVDEKDLGEEVTMNGNIFIEQIVKHHMLYVFNPEVLKDSSFVTCYIVDRTIYLKRQEEETHVYAEKYAADNTERTFRYELVVDYREPTNTKHKYIFNLGDFLAIYLEKENDIGRTYDFIMKKIRKKIKAVPELCCLTPREREWLEKAIGKELDYLIYEVLGKDQIDSTYTEMLCK